MLVTQDPKQPFAARMRHFDRLLVVPLISKPANRHSMRVGLLDNLHLLFRRPAPPLY